LRRASDSATVGTARCISYNKGTIGRAVSTCIEELPDLQEAFIGAESVLLKPNLLSSTRGPEHHVNTHPALVRALARTLQSDFGCQVAIGDSCGSFSQNSTGRALHRSGMEKVAEDLDARLYNVDNQPRRVVRSDQARIYTEMRLPENLGEFDLIVSVSKLKTHMLTYVTGPVKNMLGLVPGAAKKDAHILAPRPDDFAVLLADLYAELPRTVAFSDGVMGMEGRGPSNGDLRHVELVAASADPVALDSFCAEVMGFDPMQVPLLAECQRRGLGIAAPVSIRVRGEPAAAFAPEDFAKPPTYADSVLARAIPRWVVRGVLRTFNKRYARIDSGRCRQCGECAVNCPSDAITHDAATDSYTVDRARCICCYCCAEVCPSDAVRVEASLPTRVADWLRSPFGNS
jgi:uncharacterized protein (DUF362 family)/ferredoxin